MSAPRKTRLYAILAVVCGTVLTVALTLYALSSNIDLFIRPVKFFMARMKRRKTCHRAAPARGWHGDAGQRAP